MRDSKDRESKWLINHHGDSMVRLAGVHGFTEWRPRAAEVVQPKQIPDGLLELVFPGKSPVPFLIEVEAYPDPRHQEQMLRDAIIVRLDRGVWPDAITLILRPHGKVGLTGEVQEQSNCGTCQFAMAWRVVELWKLKAEELLAQGDVGLVPLVPLTHYNGTKEELIQKCREKIDAQARPEEHDILLVVTQIFAKFAWNDPSVLALLGGKTMLAESPLILELLAEDRQKMILKVLRTRFREVPAQTVLALQQVVDLDKLEELLVSAGMCSDVASFHAQLNGTA